MHYASIAAFSASHNGKLICLSTVLGALYVYETAARKLRKIPTGSRITCVTPSSPVSWLCGSKEGHVYKLEIDGGGVPSLSRVLTTQASVVQIAHYPQQKQTLVLARSSVSVFHNERFYQQIKTDDGAL